MENSSKAPLTSETHYHVIACLYGCMPASNDVYETVKGAEIRLRDIADELEESGNALSGSVEDWRYDVTRKTDALIDCVYIDTCNAPECLTEDD